MLTNFDKSLLNIIQRNLPISERPFLELAKILETTEDHVIERLRYLKEHGYIRRIGPFFDSGKLEYKGTLVALKVKEGYMQQVAEFINRYLELIINHIFERVYRKHNHLVLKIEGKDKMLPVVLHI